MSTAKIGEILRRIREIRQLPLRKVAVILDVDVAILSKMERGERKLTKNIISRLAIIYEYDAEELLVQFLCDKILYEIQGEDLGEKALKVAEERIKYLKSKAKNDD